MKRRIIEVTMHSFIIVVAKKFFLNFNSPYIMCKKIFFLIIILFLPLMFNLKLFAMHKADSVDVDKFDELRKQDYTIIDVRTQEEYNDGHIEGAVLINFFSPDFKDKIAELDKKGKYIVYCRSGGRSAKAILYMNEIGIKEALNLTGGINAWIKAGKPVVN